MPDEIEIKYSLTSFAAVRKALRASGATYISTADQTDRFFDTADATLLARGSGLRVRQVRVVRSAAPMNAKPMVTFKGPIKPNSSAKIRQELQTCCDDAQAFQQILAAIGMVETITVCKRRTSY